MSIREMKSTRHISSECETVTYEYFKSASLHGLPWVARTRWSNGARPFWAAVVALGIALCIYMSIILWFRYSENPTLNVVESGNYPALQIPFPSVEICNNFKLYKPHTERISKIWKNHAHNESLIQQFFSMNFEVSNRAGIDPEHMRLLQILDNHAYSVESLYKELHQPCSVMLSRCAWRNLEINCSKIITTSLVSNGFCCRFTPQYFWNNTNGSGLNYIAGFDEVQGLSLDLNLSNSKDFNINANSNFASIWVYNREKTIKSFEIFEGQRLDLAINPSLHTVTDRVRELSPDKRKCGYINDVPISSNGDLRVHYSTFESCVNHFFIQHVMDHCNCTLYYAKSIDPTGGWEKFRNCTFDNEDFKCLLKNANTGKMLPRLALQVPCMSPCEDIDYKCDADYTDLTKLKTNLSKLNIYFQDRLCFKYTRDESVSPFQLFAAFGGVFGLCLGGTVISVIEFLWFVVQFLSVIIFRCKPFNKPRVEPKEIDVSLRNGTFSGPDNRLYLNELLPYGYKDSRKIVD